MEEYLKVQRRYAHLFKPERRDDVIDALQARADRNIRRFGLIDGPDARPLHQNAGRMPSGGDPLDG